MEFDYYKYCLSAYQKEYNRCYKQLQKTFNGRTNLEKKQEEWSKEAQKAAIRVAVMKGLNEIENPSISELWSALYRVHLYKKSGVKDLDTIQKVVSADESWKKSSGHAFEEMIKELASLALEGTDISMILQRDLSIMIRMGELANEPRDISWLKDQIKANIFDLYCIVTVNGKQKCFGCVQCKTSIRDRVTRDREPSLKAMESSFWSVAFVLDGDFLKLPKFKAMVNGGSEEFSINGWHGMYVFSLNEISDRIYPITVGFDIFKNHALQAAKQWLEQRQWLKADWKTEE